MDKSHLRGIEGGNQVEFTDRVLEFTERRGVIMPAELRPRYSLLERLGNTAARPFEFIFNKVDEMRNRGHDEF